MKLSKAIEVLEGIPHFVWLDCPPDERAAIELGTEGLKRLRQNRTFLSGISVAALLGETEE